ncbi:hypothetical protein [Luteimonas sp. RC10]|uniref:hypothetical protein n=1 Tax=Luteimonas sp. RC10 TaxID=2587035 RepID=UPI001619843B|nr:hypothetical protein [Luteimonas sp. RC10]MBB3343185.1 hypothetical protein [Luteimonas sp. RC10]
MGVEGIQQCNDLNAIADNVLKEGDRPFWGDDLDGRLDFFAEQLTNVRPEERSELIDTIVEKDGGATMSWLTSEKLDKLVEDGRITDLERETITQAVADAYVDGAIGFQDVVSFTNIFGNGAVAPAGLNPNGAVVTDTIDALANSANGTAFIEKFAGEFLSERILAEPPMFTPMEQGNFAGVMLNALDQAGGSASVNAVLSDLSGDARSTLQEAVSAHGMAFTNPAFEGRNVRDPMAILIDTVSEHGTSQDVNDLVRFVGDNSRGDSFDNHYFDHQNKPLPQRAEALSDLFVNHSDTILNELTVGNEGKPSGSTNPNETHVGNDLATLSNLFRLTGLNPDNPKASQVMDAVADFTTEAINISNKLEGVDDVDGNGVVDHQDLRMIEGATADVAMITAALQDAVATGYADLEADNAARDAMAGFLIDVAVSAIPVVGSKASGPIANAVSDALGGLSEGVRKEIADALASIPEELLTTAQGQLTDTAKAAIIDALPEDYQYLEGISQDAEKFIFDTIYAQAARINDLSNTVQKYRGFIDSARG